MHGSKEFSMTEIWLILPFVVEVKLHFGLRRLILSHDSAFYTALSSNSTSLLWHLKPSKIYICTLRYTYNLKLLTFYDGLPVTEHG